MIETEPVIQVRNLVKQYKKAETAAVDNISFTVPRGDFFALLGPNGAGKTTTISILTTTLQPTSGSATIAGFDIRSQARMVRSRVGIIFQQPSLDLNLTAEENVRFHAVLYGLYPARPSFRTMPMEYRRRVTELSEVLGLEKDMFSPVKRFSGGMKRKLEIVRSLIHQPDVLFLDEPTVGLDPSSRRNLWEYLALVRERQGTTIFLTTHYLDETEDASTVCIIDKGRIVAFGPPSEVKAALVSEYVLLDAEDRDELQRELVRLGAEIEGTGPFKISVVGAEDLQRVLQGIGTRLTRLETHRPTLEDAYVAIIEQEQVV